MKTLILILVTAISIQAFSAEYTFNGPGNFSDASKWGGSLPGYLGDLTINGECIYDIEISQYNSITLNSSIPYGRIIWAPGLDLLLTCNTLNSTSTNTAVDMTNGGRLYINVTLNLAEETLIPGTGKVTFFQSTTFPTHPLTFNNLVVSGKSFLSSSIKINGILDLSYPSLFNCILNIGRYNLYLGDSSTIINAGFARGFIQTPDTGSVFRKVGNTEFEFPVGSQRSAGIDYFTNSPLTITNTGTPDVFKVSCIRGFTVPVPDNAINLEWKVSEAIPGGSNVTLRCEWNQYLETGLINHNLKLAIGRYNGSEWLETFSSDFVSGETYNTTASGFSEFGIFTVKNRTNTFYKITAMPEGLYNPEFNSLNSSDTIRAYLRNVSSPYSIVDSSIAIVNENTFTSNLQFSKAQSGTYYIVLKHRNSIETWSKSGGEVFLRGDSLTYDFTVSSSAAFGNNLTLKEKEYCIYSGDIDQDGIVNLNDLLLINNEGAEFFTGYIATDLNGDHLSDLSDALIAYNNSSNFVSIKRP